MNATIATHRPIPTTRPAPGLRERVSTTVEAIDGLVGRLSGRQRLLVAAALTGFTLAVAGLAAGPHAMGYLGVFVFSVLTNAILFLPSGRGAVMVAGAMVLNPLAVAILTGVGGAFGELTGYGLGRSSRKVLKSVKIPRWLEGLADRHMAGTILAISIIPNPFVDTVGIIAGRLGYPVRRFLVYSIVGKVVQSIAFVYLALWNISLVSSWTGIGA